MALKAVISLRGHFHPEPFQLRTNLIDWTWSQHHSSLELSQRAQIPGWQLGIVPESLPNQLNELRRKVSRKLMDVMLASEDRTMYSGVPTVTRATCAATSSTNIARLIKETSNAPGTDVVLQASTDFETLNVIFEVAIKLWERTTGTSVLWLDARTLELDLRGKTIANDTLVCNINDAVASTNFQQESTLIGHFNRLIDVDFCQCFTIWEEADECDQEMWDFDVKLLWLQKIRYDRMGILERIERAARAMIWADKCPRERLLHSSVTSCSFSQLARLLSFAGAQPRKLRIKDGQNAHGKVGRHSPSFGVSDPDDKNTERRCYVPTRASVQGFLSFVNRV
ncbi:hypothetical protein N7G274_001732 [Stereocaulon virgatum]|uniref:Uncharacterized protein n=1 Tax=Stereocaulon virgatum TaxID=373712 RepID=A0ABR4ALC7_9LECA